MCENLSQGQPNANGVNDISEAAEVIVGIIGCIKLRVLISVDIAAHNMFFTLDQEIKN